MPEQTLGSGLAKTDILNALNEDDKDVKDELETDDKEESKEEKLEDLEESDDNEDKEDDDDETKLDDKEDDKEEDEEEKEELEDDIIIDAIPKRQEILKAYPDFEKKFPGILKAVYREQKYQEQFPTIEDAKEAREIIREYDGIRAKVNTGDLRDVLKNLKETKGEAYKVAVETLFDQLGDVDEQAYRNHISKTISYGLFSVFNTAKQKDNDQLQLAVRMVRQAIFGGDVNDEPKLPKSNLSNDDEVDPEKKKFLEEKKQFLIQKQQEAQRAVGEPVTNLVKSIIKRYVDPKGQMSEWMRDKVQADCFSALDNHFRTDNRVRAIISKKWKAAAEADYSKASLEDIRNTFVTVAKAKLGSIIKEQRARALKGRIAMKKGSSQDESPLPRQGASSVRNKEKSSDKKQFDPKKDDFRSFLDQD